MNHCRKEISKQQEKEYELWKSRKMISLKFKNYRISTKIENFLYRNTWTKQKKVSFA